MAIIGVYNGSYIETDHKFYPARLLRRTGLCYAS